MVVLRRAGSELSRTAEFSRISNDNLDRQQREVFKTPYPMGASRRTTAHRGGN